MNAHRPIRKREKLPRGSYFYVQVGHRFYAGEELVRKEVTRTEEHLSPSRNIRGYGYWAGSGRRSWRNCLWERQKRKMHIPRYLKDRRTKVTTSELTGESRIQLTDDLTKVKRFRRYEQADNACKHVAAMYDGFDVKVSVKLKEGE